MDIPNVAVGGVHLKVAYLIFPFYLPFVLYVSRMRIGATRLGVYALIVTLFTPAVFLSSDIKISISYAVGILICLMVMETMYRLTVLLQWGMIDVLMWFYRATVIVTVPLVILHLQKRGHFTLYEASYWAIALIPYYCITFHQLLLKGMRAVWQDAFLIVVAIVVSASLSMVLWSLVSFAFVAFRLKKIKPSRIVFMVVGVVVLLVIAYEFNLRTHQTIDDLADADNWKTFFAAFIFMAGNRVQRVLVAWTVGWTHPIYGVGPGALVSYAMKNYQRADFTIMGISSSDFKLSQPATNVFLQVWAETGIIGTFAYLTLLVYMFRKIAKKAYAIPIQAALWITMLSLMIESSYIRTYVWMLYGVVLGIAEMTPAQEDTKAGDFEKSAVS
jgi:O-antigen ligase